MRIEWMNEWMNELCEWARRFGWNGVNWKWMPRGTRMSTVSKWKWTWLYGMLAEGFWFTRSASLAWIVAEHPFWKNLVGRHNLWEPSRTDLNRYAPWIFNGDARILNSHLDRNTICKPGSQPCLSAQWIVLCGPAGVATDKGLFPIFSTSVISIYPRDKIMIHTVASFISMIGPNQTRIDEWCIWIQVGSWGNCEFSVQAAKCPPRTRNMNRRHK